jgi:hypothetical protein
VSGPPRGDGLLDEDRKEESIVSGSMSPRSKSRGFGGDGDPISVALREFTQPYNPQT